MPKRQTVKKIDTSEMQGEGSHIIITAVKVKEIRLMRTASQEDPDFDSFQAGLDLIQQHIKSWNWVDDEETPLAQPSDDPSVIEELTTAEVSYLADLLTDEGDSKN